MHGKRLGAYRLRIIRSICDVARTTSDGRYLRKAFPSMTTLSLPQCHTDGCQVADGLARARELCAEALGSLLISIEYRPEE